MIKNMFLPFLASVLLLTGIAYPAGTISSVSGTYNEGQTITINGSSLGSHSDNGGSEPYLQFKFDTFDDNSTVTEVFDYADDIALTTTNERTGSIKHVERSKTGSGGGLGVNSSSTNDGYFTSYWVRFRSGTTWASNGQAKLTRIHRTSGATGYPNVTFMKHFGSSIGTNNVYVVESSSTSTNGTNYHGNHSIFNDGLWHYVENWFKPSTGVGNADGQYFWRIDGTQVANESGEITDGGGLNTFAGWWRVFDYTTGASLDHDIDDQVFDYTRAQVYLCNSATFSNATHRELQKLLSWSSSVITFELNAGSFTAGETVYCFVTDSNGNPSNAISFVMGESSGVPPNPEPDTGTPITEKRITLNGVTIELNGVTITYE